MYSRVGIHVLTQQVMEYYYQPIKNRDLDLQRGTYYYTKVRKKIGHDEKKYRQNAVQQKSFKALHKYFFIEQILSQLRPVCLRFHTFQLRW